jgi:hypothetical protein
MFTDLEVGISAIFQSLLMDIHTALIGKVISFDAVNQKVKVQPVLKRKYKNKEPGLLAVVDEIPVLFLGSGDWWITFDVKPDSYVLLIVSERSLDIWTNQGGLVDPADSRKFNLNDAIAIPGINPLPDIIIPPVESDCISIRNRLNTKFIRLDATGISIKDKLMVDGITESKGVVDVSLMPISKVTLSNHTHNDSLGFPTTAPLPEPPLP